MHMSNPGPPSRNERRRASEAFCVLAPARDLLSSSTPRTSPSWQAPLIPQSPLRSLVLTDCNQERVAAALRWSAAPALSPAPPAELLRGRPCYRGRACAPTEHLHPCRPCAPAEHLRPSPDPGVLEAVTIGSHAPDLNPTEFRCLDPTTTVLADLDHEATYAAAKAKKLQDEQLKCHKKNKDSTPKPKFDAPREGKAPGSSPYRTSAQLPSNKGLPISSSSRQKQPLASSGGEISPVYSELSFTLHGNLFQDDISDLDSMDVVHNVVYDIIQKGGEAGKITKVAKKLKLKK